MLKLAENLKLPEALLAQHMAVLGKTRSGKSSVLRLFVESLLDRDQRVCVIDPKGDWHGLRSSADGKHAGYPVIIFGGAKADVLLNQHAGASVAELVATGNRPCVIDLGGWMVAERTRFFIEFASTLFRATPQPLHLVIDEVHNFAPQGKILDPDAGKMLHWANRLASEGAGKGIVILSASQRPQKVHKDFLTCAETLVAMRVIHKLDRDAVKDWIDGAGDPAKGREVLNTLALMARGEGWVWSPEAGFGPERVKFPLFKTYDSFAAPTAGQRAAALKGWAEVDLEAVKAKLAAVVEEAKANDPKELKRQITDLRKQLAGKPTAQSDPAAIEAALAKRDREWQASIKEHAAIIDSLKGRMGKAVALLNVNGEATPKAVAPAKVVVTSTPKTPSRSPLSPLPSRESRAVTAGDRSGLTKAQKRILDALAWYESIGTAEPTNLQVGAVAMIDTSGGYFSNTMGPLSTNGLVERGAGSIRLTDAGRNLAQAPESLASIDDYHEMLRGRVKKVRSANGKTIEILNVVIAKGGEELSPGEIGEAVGVDHTGGYFSNSIGPLGTLGLIERKSGRIKPTSLLFPENVF